MNINQQKVASVLKKHFYLNRKQLDATINASLKETNGVYFTLADCEQLTSSIKDYSFYVSGEKESKIANLWNYEKLTRTALFANFFDMEQNSTGDIFCFILGDPFVMRRAESYSGVGGLFCKTSPGVAEGVVVEPLKHYLETHFEFEGTEDPF
jgi:hypothetical protein